MPTKILPTEYLGANYTGDTSTGINNSIGSVTSLIVTYNIGFTVDIQTQEVTEE